MLGLEGLGLGSRLGKEWLLRVGEFGGADGGRGRQCIERAGAVYCRWISVHWQLSKWKRNERLLIEERREYVADHAYCTRDSSTREAIIQAEHLSKHYKRRMGIIIFQWPCLDLRRTWVG